MPLRNLAFGVLMTLGAEAIAKTTRAIRDEPQRALPILGITYNQDPPTELDQALPPRGNHPRAGSISMASALN